MPKPESLLLPMPKSGPFGKAEIDEMEYQFGTKQVGASDEHTFTIKNAGEGPLEFKLGKPTCQCTLGEVTKEGPLAPGESVSILVKWNMKSEMEKFRQMVPVYTTDPERRTIELSVTGVVDSPIHLIPEGYWDVGNILHTQPTTGNGVVVSTVLDAFELTEIPRENSRVKLTIEPMGPEILKEKSFKSGYRVTVEVPPDVPVGMFRESIKLKVIADGTEVIREVSVTGKRTGPIDVRGNVGAGFNTTSNRLIFSDFPATAGKTAKLTFYVKGMTEDLALKAIEPADAPFKIRFLDAVTAVGNSKGFPLEVVIPPGPPGKHREDDAVVVVLKLNHPEVPDFKLLIDYNATR